MNHKLKKKKLWGRLGKKKVEKLPKTPPEKTLNNFLETNRKTTVPENTQFATVYQARNQGEHLGHLPPLKFSKHCIAILTFVETFKEKLWNFIF